MTYAPGMDEPLPADKKRCSQCEAIIDRAALICMRCRADQPAAAAPSVPSVPAATDIVHRRKNKTTAGLLAIFLGGVGAHKFYLGQTSNGILYAVLCFTLIPALLGLIDGIRILAMTPERFAQRFG